MGEADRALLAEGKETVVQFRQHALRCWTWGEASAPGVMILEATGPFQTLVRHSLGAATIVTAAKLGGDPGRAHHPPVRAH